MVVAAKFAALVAFVAAAVSATEPLKTNRTVLFHSHNDYVHKRPVFDAFDHNVFSYESDVWYDKKADDFYVAHTVLGIDHSKTFKTQTIEPVVELLSGKYSDKYPASNPEKFKNDPNNKPTANPDWYKYYSEGFGGVRPIQLLLETKSSDDTNSWPKLVEQLEPLRKRGWLTKYENGVVTFGPVIVVGTGGTPFHDVAVSKERDYFLDCPAGSMKGTALFFGETYSYNSTLCPIASASYNGVPHSNLGILPPPRDAIPYFHKYIDQVHKADSTARFYGVPEVLTRIADFNMLLQQGADWLNIDDLDDAKKYSN